MSTRVPIAPGTVLGGRYRIAGLAGEGGMGDIYEAMDLSLERRVALKRIRGSSEDSARERFRREALALAQLNHPSICQVFELAETAHGTFIAMEWIEGETLHARLRRGAVPWREAAEILAQTAEALAAAHVKGLVHRDLKPGNLMLTPEGRVKVLDFGLVRFAGPASAASAPPHPEEAPTMAGDFGESVTYGAALSGSGSGRALTLIGSFMGTLGYTSPEQALARPVTPASDVFNLGLLAQEMVTNQRAYLGEGRDALDAVVDNHREPFPRKFAPKPYRALTDRLLSPKPKDRPTAEEAAKAFHALIAPHGALWWSGLSAALVLLIGGAGLWLYSRGVIAGLVKGRPARVAVLGFKNTTGVPLLNAQTELGLADLVASRLRTVSKLQVLDGDAVAQAAAALKLSPAESSLPDQLRLSRILGADLLLTGEMRREEGFDRLRYELIDMNGRVRSVGVAETPTGSQIVLESSRLASDVAGRISKAVAPLSKESVVQIRELPLDAFAAYSQGVEASRRGHYAEAEPLLSKAAYGDPNWDLAAAAYASVLTNLARPEADPALRWALTSARASADSYMETNISVLIGIRALEQHDMASAEVAFEQGLTQARLHGNQATMAFCLNGLGQAALATGKLDTAERRFAEALECANQSGDLIAQTQINTSLGNLALSKGDLDGAIRRYQSVVNISRPIGYESGEARGLNNLGIALLSSFQLSEARPALERSLAIREKNGEARWIVSGHRNLGILAQMEGHEESAQASFQRSLEKAVGIPDAYGEGQARFYLAGLDLQSGRITAALAGFRRASALSETSHDQTRLGQELAGQAECLARLNQPREAASLRDRAEKLIPGNPYLLRAQAWAAFLDQDRPKALSLIDEAIRDPQHDAPEIRRELLDLRLRFR